VHVQTVTGKYKHRVIVINRAALHPADEEVVLVHIYLDAGRSSVEILECLRTMLQRGANCEDKMRTKKYTLVRASSLGHLYDRRDRTSSGSPSQTFHSICQLPPGSEWVIGHRIVVPTAVVKLPSQRRGDQLPLRQSRAVSG